VDDEQLKVKLNTSVGFFWLRRPVAIFAFACHGEPKIEASSVRQRFDVDTLRHYISNRAIKARQRNRATRRVIV